MSQQHLAGPQGSAPSSELEREQAHVERAYVALARARDRALGLRSMVEVGRGGTNQARVEAEVIEDTIRERLSSLELGDAALVFGRIDTEQDEAFHIGRIAVSDDDQEPLVVDWRAPVAEPFYRATGRQTMGLSRRRHFVTRGRAVIGLEDEVFATGDFDENRLRGEGALMSALERARTGELGDIVGTIQGEQDEIIRAPLPGALVVQGGPGTGKTVVALHRAAYLLYTYRFPLEGQGVLVVGPNRFFLRYIQRVLPSLGEAGAELAVLADLVAGHVPSGTGGRVDPPRTHELKGDLRMRSVLRRAVRDRERGLRNDLVVDFGVQRLRLTTTRSAEIVRNVRRRFQHHNAGRRLVEEQVYDALVASARREVDIADVRRRLRGNSELRAALEWMWPVLRPPELLRDLFGSMALLRSAGRGSLDDAEVRLLHRARAASLDEMNWTDADLPLLDEADRLLGPQPDQKRSQWEPKTYGHLVIDEAQDLSPMALRMLGRRSLNGSMTLVGDIAQATSPGAVDDWAQVVELLGHESGARHADLTIGYRIPASLMGPAIAVLAEAEPTLEPPRAVRVGGSEPVIEQVADVAQVIAARVRRELDEVGQGTVAVIGAEASMESLAEALRDAGIEHGRMGGEHRPARLDAQVSLVPVRLVKGLEVDSAIVVEPAAVVAAEPRGLRALYVGLTRATRRLTILHRDPLPVALRAGEQPVP